MWFEAVNVCVFMFFSNLASNAICAVVWTIWVLGDVLLTVHELSKIISRKNTMLEITCMMRIASWHFARVRGFGHHTHKVVSWSSHQNAIPAMHRYQGNSWRASETLVKHPAYTYTLCWRGILQLYISLHFAQNTEIPKGMPMVGRIINDATIWLIMRRGWQYHTEIHMAWNERWRKENYWGK